MFAFFASRLFSTMEDIPDQKPVNEEPEQEFLTNSATMAHYATQELKQFLRWTGKNTPQHGSAQALLQELERITADLNLLQRDYRHR